MNRRKNEQNGSTIMVVMVVILSITTIAFAGVALWAYTEWQKKATDVNGQIALEVAEAKREQAEQDSIACFEKSKEPTLEFKGPDDYGSLRFRYPRTWSWYEASDISRGGDYEAFLNPVKVPTVRGSDSRFALRVMIENKSYDSVLQQYDSAVKKGDLQRSETSSNGISGARFDGNFNKDIRGSAVVYKLRDKTITIQTDSEVFKDDFNKLIKTIEFNQ